MKLLRPSTTAADTSDGALELVTDGADNAQRAAARGPKRRGSGRGTADSVVNTDGHVIGLDIGATAIRAAILSPAPTGESMMSVSDLGQVPLPPGTIVDGVVAEPGELTRVLTGMWKTFDFGCRHVIIGVSNPQVVVRPITVPRLPREQQIQALPFQARDVIALPLDQVLLDFQELGPVDGDPDSVSGLLIAAPRQPVVVAVKAVEAAGLRIVRVDLASFATLRAAAGSAPTEAVIDVGAQMTTIIVHHRGVPRMVRTLARGGEQLTERLVERTGCSTTEADILKTEIGLVGGDSEVSIILKGAIRPLITDIRGSLQYFGSANDALTLERVSLTGGGAQLPGFAEVLTEDIGVTCTVVSPLQHVHTAITTSNRQPEDVTAAATAVSVGLAMGAAA